LIKSHLPAVRRPHLPSWLHRPLWLHWPSRRTVKISLGVIQLVLGGALVLLGVALIYYPFSIILLGSALLAAVWFTNIE
jgi:hypothetical protein